MSFDLRQAATSLIVFIVIFLGCDVIWTTLISHTPFYAEQSATKAVITGFIYVAVTQTILKAKP